MKKFISNRAQLFVRNKHRVISMGGTVALRLTSQLFYDQRVKDLRLALDLLLFQIMRNILSISILYTCDLVIFVHFGFIHILTFNQALE